MSLCYCHRSSLAFLPLLALLWLLICFLNLVPTVNREPQKIRRKLPIYCFPNLPQPQPRSTESGSPGQGPSDASLASSSRLTKPPPPLPLPHLSLFRTVQRRQKAPLPRAVRFEHTLHSALYETPRNHRISRGLIVPIHLMRTATIVLPNLQGP